MALDVLTLFEALAQNLALLLSLVFIYSLTAPRLRQVPPGTRGVITGALFGVIALVGMLLRIEVEPGVVVDGRSVVVALAGVSGGVTAAVVAAALVTAYRLWLGGVGTIPGVGVILTAMALGVWVRWRWRARLREFGPGHFFLLGAALAASGLLWTLLLPDAALARRMLGMFAPTVGALYPLGTLLAGLLLSHAEVERERATLAEHSIAQSSEAVFWVDSGGRLVNVNGAALELCGRSRDDLLSLHVWDLDVKWQQEGWPGVWNTLRERARLTYESSLRTKDGRLIPTDVSVVFLEFEGIEYGCAFVRDVTLRKRGDAALRESEERYRMIVETMDEVVYRVDTSERDPLRGTVRFVSSQVESILGYRPDEFLEDPGLWFRIVHPDDRSTLVESTRNIFASREGGTRQYRLRHKGTAEYRWMEDRVVPQTDDRGDVIAIQGGARDITDRKRLEAEVERGRREAEVLAELAQTINSSLELGAILQRVAEGARALAGSDSALIGLRDAGGGGDAVVIRHQIGTRYEHYDTLRIEPGRGLGGQVLLTGRPARTRNYAEDPEVDREYLPVVQEGGVIAVLALPIRIGERVEGLLYVGNRSPRPFTERDEAILLRLADHAAIAIENARLLAEAEHRQQAAEEMARLARVMTENLDVSVVGERVVKGALSLLRVQSSSLRVLQADGSLMAIASAGPFRFERGHTQAPGVGVAGRAAAEGRPVWSRDMTSDPAIDLDDRVRSDIARWGIHAALAVPLRVNERIIGALVVGDQARRDFSEAEVALLQALADQGAIALENSRLYGELRAAVEELEASQRQIVETERLRALGELAGGVAHNFNNTLAIILGRVELLLAQARSPNAQRQLRAIERTALDAARTVKRIEEFTRLRPGRPFQAVGLNQLVDEVVELTRHRWKDEAQAGGIAYDVSTEKAALPPVAGDPSELREALTNLVFNALDAMPGGGRITFRTGLEGERVVCAVTDTGVGMTEEVKQRVFDPFFTTKGERGSGLGLSVVYGIIARHGGTIDVQSEPEQGTTFTIRLPVGGDVVPVVEEASPPRSKRKGKILIIDDEPELREVLGELLTAQGHAVTACADGESGLRRFQEEPFDLVITDLGMPGVSGWEVVKRIKGRSPETPVALLTGWGDQIAPEEARGRGVDFLMCKPFTPEEIQAVIARALASKA